MNVTEKAVELKPCPFCGEPAEVDMLRGFRSLQGGRLHSGVSIYCSAQCHVELMLSRADLPEYDDDQLYAILAENWNKRAALTAALPHMGVARELEQLAKNYLAASEACTGIDAISFRERSYGVEAAIRALSALASHEPAPEPAHPSPGSPDNVARKLVEKISGTEGGIVAVNFYELCARIAEALSCRDQALQAENERLREERDEASPAPVSAEIEAAYRAGHADGRTGGSCVTVDDEWAEYRAALNAKGGE